MAMGKELTHQLTARETSEQESEQIRNIEQTVRTGQAAPTRSGQSLENTVPIRELTRKRSYNRGKRLKRNIRTTRQRSR